MALVTLGAVPADAANISANWAGYVAVSSANAGLGFGSVSGSWTQPRATCSRGREASSAVWVGLGGYNEHSQALEQIGTDDDCERSGQVSYSTWYELVPAAPVNLKLRVHPGDQMTASVTVRSHEVTLRIRDLSSGARFALTRAVSSIDVSSADWIVEAPSVCIGANA